MPLLVDDIQQLVRLPKDALCYPWRKPKPDPLACYDCKLLYSDPAWVDVIVPDDLWARISPAEVQGYKGGGVLCFTCMVRRCVALGIEHAFYKIVSGPFA